MTAAATVKKPRNQAFFGSFRANTTDRHCIKYCRNIDSPYNTGKDSFLQPDNFSMSGDDYEDEIGLYDKDGNKLFTENNTGNSRFHSTWCSMIYSRLMLEVLLLNMT